MHVPLIRFYSVNVFCFYKNSNSFPVLWRSIAQPEQFIENEFSVGGSGTRLPGALTNILNIRETTSSRRTSYVLLELLRPTRHFQVIDPRDKIFALLGMMGELPHDLKSIIEHRLSVDDLYRRAGLYIIQKPCPSEVLAHAGLQRQGQRKDMPSWVPDWQADDRDRNKRPLGLLRPGPFGASGNCGQRCSSL